MKKLLPVFAVLLMTVSLFAQTPEARLSALGITLPEPPSAVANYVPIVRSGNLVFLAGHLPREADRAVVTGRVPSAVTAADAKEAARLAAIELLATLKAELGNLSRVKRIVRVEAFVNSDDDFTGQSGVVNGCSDLLVEVFGEAGRHARLAIGVNTLPLGATLEISLIAEVD